MKRNAFILLTILLSLLGGGNAFAQNETYDFTSISGDFTYGGTYSGITNGKYWEKIGNTPIYGRFADCTDSSRGWFFNSGKLRCWGGRYRPELAICNLHKGDRVVITFTESLKFVSGSAKQNNVALSADNDIVSGIEIITTNDGDFIVKGNGENGSGYTPINFTFISKIEIYYRSTETYTFTGNYGESAAPVAANSDIVPGASNYEPVTIDGESGFVLDFTNQTYGYGYFNHPENRFFIKEEGWKVNNNGLQIKENDTESFYAFYILNLNASDRVMVNLNNPLGVTGNLALFWSTNTGNATLSALTSGTTYTMQSGGILKILVRSSVAITSVTITPSPIRFTKLTDTYNLVDLDYTEPTLIVPSDATVTYSSNNTKVATVRDTSTGDLMIVNTGTVTITATANIWGSTYTAAYELTVIAAEAVWDVRNGNECYFPTTNVNNPASNNNTGKLLMRRVTSVPHITMEFGDASNENLAMVTFRPPNENNAVRAANLIDQGGWVHIWLEPETPGSTTLKPYQGTFYKFQPTISGTLTIYGVLHHNTTNSRIVLVDADATAADGLSRASVVRDGQTCYSYYIKKELTLSGSPSVTDTIKLTGGHTYYLYANTPNTDNESWDWQAFYLSGFKYETTFKFTHQNVVMGNSGVQAPTPGYYHISTATNYTQTINDAGSNPDITYSIIRKGNISNNVSIDQNTGTISGITSNDHGAIVVTATLTGGGTTSKTSYVLTLPYTTIADGGRKRWVFNLENYNYNGGNPTGDNAMEQLEQLKTNAPANEWTIKYKVRRYNAVTRALEYINVPVLANALDVRGDNARYIGTTEGLLFNANASSFGTTTGVKDTDYRITSGKVEKKVNGNWVELTDASDIDVALKTLLGYNAADAAGSCYYLTLENGASMTIPNLKAGQHIRIKWSRYSENHGDRIRVNNVTDLGGNSMDGATITVGAGSNVNQNGGNGYHEFIVRNNGDVTFTVAQDGWINIYEIDIDGEFINTDLRLADGESLIRKQKAGEQFEHIYSIKWGEVLSQSNADVSYYIKDGSLTGTLNTDNCKVEDIDGVRKKLIVGSGGHGRFILVEEGRVKDSNNENISYVLDRKETLVKVYEYDYTPQSYPRTWNMENISAATVSALVADSSLVDDGGNFKTWRKADTDQFKMTLEPENLISWSTKTAVDGTQTTINELNGLGIRPADITRKNNSIVFNNADHSIDVSGADAQILTVPNVINDHTAYIRVKKGTDASVTAKYTANTTTADQPLTTVYDDGTYAVYSVPGGGKVSDNNAHIIDFYLNNVSVIQVAVSKDTKTISAAGYATETRDYPVDYTMTGTLTGEQFIAYKINGVGDNKVVSTRVDYVPAGAGVMVTGNVTSQTTRPFFTTDVNRTNELSDMSGNLLVGLITGEVVYQTTVENGTTYYNYILANKGRNVKVDGDTHTASEEVNGLGYYLIYKEGTVTGENTTYTPKALKANSAYLKLNSFQAIHQSLNSGSNSAPTYCFFLDFNDEPTAIDGIPVDTSSLIQGQKDVYYTLQGVRVTTPAKGNVYIHNGKKVYIK